MCRLGSCFYALAGVAGWALSPMLALLAFLALPIFYAITSEGLGGNPHNLAPQIGGSQPRKFASSACFHRANGRVAVPIATAKIAQA